jgi:hypothetical protein
MNKLTFLSRKWEKFDVENTQHRLWFSEFVRSGSWKHCPVRFFVLDDSGDIVSAIQRDLLRYYFDQEFVVVNQE